MVPIQHSIQPLFAICHSAFHDCHLQAYNLACLQASHEAAQPLHEGVMVDGKLLRFSLCEFRGDWEHHCASWNLARRWNGRNPCFKCHTGIRGNDSYVNFPDDITEFSHAHFIANILKPGQICAFATCKSAVDSFFELCTTDGWIRLLPNKTHLRSFSGSDGIPRINDQMVLVPQFKPRHLPSLQR